MSDDVNAADRHGRTALMKLAQEGGPEAVEALIAKGANVNARDEYGWTA